MVRIIIPYLFPTVVLAFHDVERPVIEDHPRGKETGDQILPHTCICIYI